MKCQLTILGGGLNLGFNGTGRKKSEEKSEVRIKNAEFVLLYFCILTSSFLLLTSYFCVRTGPVGFPL
jgi:hypothetical protein